MFTLLPQRDDVEEVLQRVAVTLVRKFDEYDASRPFAAWAVGIAKFEVMMFRRERASSKIQVVDDELLEQIAASYQKLTEERTSTQDALKKCLEKLDSKSRRLIELRYADAAKPAAISRAVGLSSGAVRTALCKIRIALRNCVERNLRLEKVES